MERTGTMRPLLAALAAASIAACGGGGGGGGGDDDGNDPPAQQALQAEIDRLFPFTPNQPLAMTYVCSRANSRLTYYFDLDTNGRFNVFIELDNYDQVSFGGVYTYTGGAIRFVADPNDILMLDETTTRIVPHLGLPAELYTAGMSCGAVGHRYNDAATDTFKAFGCPAIHRGPASHDENAFEFVHSANPFGYVVRGGIFRQKDVDVYDATGPIVTRGYGIFRRAGDRFYADFGGQFRDHALLSGRFSDADRRLSVDQLEPEAGPCTRR